MVKVTDPVGVVWDPWAVTIAVKVTGWPDVDRLAEDASVVVVGCRLGASTVCVGRDPVLEMTFASPLDDAVTECCPAVSVDVTNCASSWPPTTESDTGGCV